MSKVVMNIPAENANAARRAAEETGIPVRISADATDLRGRPIPDYVKVTVRLRTDDQGERFWRAYDRLARALLAEAGGG